MSRTAAQTRVDDNAMAKGILGHWTEKFSATDTVNEPFQHFFCEGIWPAEVYDQIISSFPDGSLYRPLNIKQWVNAAGESTRDKCYLPDVIEQMQGPSADLWHQIWLALTSETLKRAIFRKFKRDVALRLKVAPDKLEDTEVFVTCSLVRDVQDYRIKPHPDGWPGIVTAQFYMPQDASQEDLGTSFYEERSLLRRLVGGRYHEIKRMRFLPNSGYMFAINDLPDRRSLHGRELITEGSGVRNSLIVRWTAMESSRKHGREGISKTHTLF